MKKNCFALIGILFIMLFITACATVPIQQSNTFPSDGRYEVLGRVTVESRTTKSGYIKLLEEAKKQYPGTDDIVNIMIDGKTRLFSTRYQMTGIAIKYK